MTTLTRMPTTRDHAQRTVDVLADLGLKPAVRLSDRIGRVRASLVVAVQAGIAAGIAWYLARDVIGHPAPFFAPVSAVIVLGVSTGQRLRRAVELVIGVALGIGVGDILIYFIGTGGWQIALVVVLAILAAVFVGGSDTLIGQCASSSVLVATLAPPSNGIYYTRFVDALVGGLVGVGVMAILLPVNPLTTVQKAVVPALDLLAAELTGCADALADQDVSRARAALDRHAVERGGAQQIPGRAERGNRDGIDRAHPLAQSGATVAIPGRCRTHRSRTAERARARPPYDLGAG